MLKIINYVIMITACTIIFMNLVYANPVGSERVQLTCNVLAQGNGTVTECENYDSFPYIVPQGQYLCATDFILTNKFPWDPHTDGPNGLMRTMYFQLPGISVAAHSPQIHLITPLAFSGVVRAWIQNGMVEPQWVYGIVTGYLSSSWNCD